MAIHHRIVEDGSIDPDRRARQHREIDGVTRPGVDLDGTSRRLDDRHGIEDGFRQHGDPHFGQPRPGGGEQVHSELVGLRPGHLPASR
jgi:hypothetical protein